MSYVSHQSIGYSRILESRNLEYYVIIFLFTFYWESKFLIGQKRKKFSVKTGFEELKKKVNKYNMNIRDFEIPKFETTQLIDEIHTT